MYMQAQMNVLNDKRYSITSIKVIVSCLLFVCLHGYIWYLWANIFKKMINLLTQFIKISKLNFSCTIHITKGMLQKIYTKGRRGNCSKCPSLICCSLFSSLSLSPSNQSSDQNKLNRTRTIWTCHCGFLFMVDSITNRTSFLSPNKKKQNHTSSVPKQQWFSAVSYQSCSNMTYLVIRTG